MGNKDIYFIRNELFRVIICKSKELDSLYFTASVLEEVNILWKFFNILCIPKTQVMVACDKNLVLIRQFYEPVQEVKNFFLCTLFREVATMHNNISNW